MISVDMPIPPPMAVMFVPTEAGMELHVTSPVMPELHKVHQVDFESPDMELMKTFVRTLLRIMLTEMIQETNPNFKIEDLPPRPIRDEPQA